MRRASQSDCSRLLGALIENNIPSIGFLSAFPEALGFRGAAASQPPPNTAELEKKVDLLINCGAETRKALSIWRTIEDDYLREPDNVLPSIEESAFKLRQTVLLEDEDAIDLGDPEATPSSPESLRTKAEVRLAEVAGRVFETAPPGLFEPPEAAASVLSPPFRPTKTVAEKQMQQLAHLAKVLHVELSYRQEPYEWVYDGLSPLLLDAVAGSCEGIHISLAALYCAVGRRLACSILPEIARPLEASGDEAAILAGLSLATAPAPDPCLLRIDSGTQTGSLYFLDPTNGTVMDRQTATHHFPGLKQTSPPSPLGFWSGLLRTAMTAHQRRGDGDAVAHCLHQLLAMDMHAPEWASALRPAAIRR